MDGAAPPMKDAMDRAARVVDRADLLATVSETADGLLTRTFGSEAMRRANACVAEWMRAAGLDTRTDAIGNLRGMQPRDGRPLLLLGSHLDTVREAGRFDGILGVLIGLACAEAAAAGGYGMLPFRLGVVGFSDEEGVRFQTAYLGSEVLAGTFDIARLSLRDAHEITIADAITVFGGRPEALATERLDAAAEGGLLGYCEVHIEQGPVLESRNLPVGIVSAIAGQSRFAFRFEGRAGHAGTTPMGLRADALAAAAEFVQAVEARALGDPGLVATVGQLEIRPGASNVIAGSAAGSLDVRSPLDAQRLAGCRDLAAAAAAIAARRGGRLAWRLVQEHAATACDAGLRRALGRAVAAAGISPLELPSGAGHDAVALAAAMPVAMLFVRCRDGLSHHPEESVTREDVACALKVMDKFLSLLATSNGFSEESPRASLPSSPLPIGNA